MGALIGCGCLMNGNDYWNRAPYYENSTSGNCFLVWGSYWEDNPKSNHYDSSISVNILCRFLR